MTLGQILRDRRVLIGLIALWLLLLAIYFMVGN
jgi:hypothetical protein